MADKGGRAATFIPVLKLSELGWSGLTHVGSRKLVEGLAYGTHPHRMENSGYRDTIPTLVRSPHPCVEHERSDLCITSRSIRNEG